MVETIKTYSCQYPTKSKRRALPDSKIRNSPCKRSWRATSSVSVQINKSTPVAITRSRSTSFPCSILFAHNVVWILFFTSGRLISWMCLSRLMIYDYSKHLYLEHRKPMWDSRSWGTNGKVTLQGLGHAIGVEAHISLLIKNSEEHITIKCWTPTSGKIWAAPTDFGFPPESSSSAH